MYQYLNPNLYPNAWITINRFFRRYLPQINFNRLLGLLIRVNPMFLFKLWLITESTAILNFLELEKVMVNLDMLLLSWCLMN